jgi:hypothetical protein
VPTPPFTTHRPVCEPVKITSTAFGELTPHEFGSIMVLDPS